MKKSILLAFAALFLMMSSSSCGRIKDFEVTSCALKSLSPSGMRGLDAVLALGIKNPTIGFTIKDINATVKQKGTDFAYFSANSLAVQRRSEQVYNVPCNGTLAKGTSIVNLLKLARTRDFTDFTVDIDVKFRALFGIARGTLHFKDYSLMDLLEAAGFAQDGEEIQQILDTFMI